MSLFLPLVLTLADWLFLAAAVVCLGVARHRGEDAPALLYAATFFFLAAVCASARWWVA